MRLGTMAFPNWDGRCEYIKIDMKCFEHKKYRTCSCGQKFIKQCLICKRTQYNPLTSQKKEIRENLKKANLIKIEVADKRRQELLEIASTY